MYVNYRRAKDSAVVHTIRCDYPVKCLWNCHTLFFFERGNNKVPAFQQKKEKELNESPHLMKYRIISDKLRPHKLFNLFVAFRI